MNDKRQSGPWVVIAILVVAIPLLSYVAGYFCLGTYIRSEPHDEIIVRAYRYAWLRDAYAPMGKLEWRLRGTSVVLAGPEIDAWPLVSDEIQERERRIDE